MSKSKLFVGLDYHKDSVQVCVMNDSGLVLANKRVPNNCSDIEDAVSNLEQADVYAAIEASTGASDLVDELVLHAGWSVDQAHPGYVSRIKQSPDKSDFSDAQLLADLERVGYLPRVWHPPTYIRELRRLVRFRQHLAGQRRSIKLRIRSLLRDHRITDPGVCGAWTKRWLKWLASTDTLEGISRWIMDEQLEHLELLECKIAKVEKELVQFCSRDRLVEKLLEQPGVGFITAVTMRAEIGRFDRFRSGKQLSRFCGLSPRNESSGKKQSTSGVIKAGNPELRRVLTQLAQRLIRYDRRWGKLAARMHNSGKKTCVIVSAIANRWMRRQFHLWKEVGLAA